MIKVQHLTFAYAPLRPGDPSVPVFTDLDLQVHDGTARAVMGATGTGKSTLGYILAGLAPRYTDGEISGYVEVAGVDVLAHPPRAGTVGVLFQDAATQLFTTSAAEEVAWGLEAMGVPPLDIEARIDQALQRFGLRNLRQRPPWALSGGQQKRLALAALWVTRPRTLVLDEPLGGLDPEGRLEVLDAIEVLRQTGTTLLVMTLRPQTAQQCAGLSLLRDGRLSAPETPTKVLQKEDSLVKAGILYPSSLWPELGPRQPPDGDKPAIVVENLHFGYTPDEEVLHGIDLRIPQGQFVALVGPNGAGKSTLVRHMNGLLRAQRGHVVVMGRTIGQRPTGEIARDVGFLFQRPEQQIFSSTVWEEVAYGPQRLGLPNVEERTQRALAQFGLEEHTEMPPALLGYGTQRAVTLASVSALATPIVILDEPTVGLDGWGLAQLLDWIAKLRERQTTIMLVTHEMALAAEADRVIALGGGRVVADGEPTEVLAALYSQRIVA